MITETFLRLKDFTLPSRFPWEIGFVTLIQERWVKNGWKGEYVPPRFMGYYFAHMQAVVVARNVRVTFGLEEDPGLELLWVRARRLTNGKCSIRAATGSNDPSHILIHDRRDGTCWVSDFTHGWNFVRAEFPFIEGKAPDNYVEPEY